MAKTKSSQYILTELKKNIALPGFRRTEDLSQLLPGQRRRMNHVVWLDNTTVPCAKMYAECVWFFPVNMINVPTPPGKGPEAHAHPFSEIITFFGTNRGDPTDLGGEIELWLEDEKFVMTKSFLCYVPAGMKHCPLKMRNVKRPIFHFTIGLGNSYQGKVPVADKKIRDHSHLFVFQNKPNLKLPEFRHEIPKERAYRMVYLDKEVVPETDFYLEGLWFWPRQPDTNQKPGVPEHVHDFDEVISFFGSNPDDLHDLGGEVDLWIDGEKNVLTRSFMAYVPAGVKHCPITVKRVDRPIFHFTAGPGTMYE